MSFTSGLAQGLSSSMASRRRGADDSEASRKSRIGGLMEKIGQSNTLTSTADAGDDAASRMRAQAAAGGNETKMAQRFERGGMVGRNYAKC